eukprot:1482952-Amphidinium_carterae.1
MAASQSDNYTFDKDCGKVKLATLSVQLHTEDNVLLKGRCGAHEASTFYVHMHRHGPWFTAPRSPCLLYTSDAADDTPC